MSTPGRRLIEEVLPIRSVSVEAAREKSIRHGHVSTLHIWWARRPLVACRAAVIGALLGDPGPGKERDGLVEFLERFCTWEASNDSRMVEEARRLVLEHSGGAQRRVLDCFAGGGAIPLEALRVGCKTDALELNPVAVMIELCTLVYPHEYGKPASVTVEKEVFRQGRKTRAKNEEVVPNRLVYDVERWGLWVLEEARAAIGQFYLPDSDGSVPVAYLWARTVRCPNPKCGIQMPLMRQLWLSNRPNMKIALKMVSKPREKRVVFELVDNERIDFDPKNATMKLGTVQCPSCGHASRSDYIMSEAVAGRMSRQLTAVVLTKEGSPGKRYRAISKRDVRLFQKAEEALHESSGLLEAVGGLPEEPIPRPEIPGFEGEAKPFYVELPIVNYGIATFRQLFDSRQLLALGTFVEKVREAHDRMLEEFHDEKYAKAVTSYLAMAVDRLADYISCHTIWAGDFIAHTFGRQVIPMVWDYAELNPFSRSTGDWLSALNWVGRVIVNCSTGDSSVAVRQGTATELPYPDGSFDAIITDPPYYDNVPYSILSDFFYVWLKRAVGDLYPEFFATPLTPKGPEIIQMDSIVRRVPPALRGKVKDRAFFEGEMGKAFREMYRVLKPDGLSVVVFAHKTTTAWEALINALIDSGFSVTASWPLHTERPGRLIAWESAALASSVWLICRKRSPQARVGSWKAVQRQLEERVRERMEFFLSQGIKGADALLSAIGPAMEVFGRYSKVEKLTGESVTVSEFLDKAREVVSRHALATVLEGEEMGTVDPPTAFYVLWKWSFEGREEVASGTSNAADVNFQPEGSERSEKGGEDEAAPSTKESGRIRIPADDAFKLARSVGAEFDEMIRPEGILRKEKEHAILLGPMDRRETKGLGELTRNGRPPALIDVVHRAVNHWAAGEHTALEDFLDASGARSNETFWKIVGALSRILSLDSVEKRLVDGLWSRYGRGPSESAYGREGKAQTRLEGFGQGS